MALDPLKIIKKWVRGNVAAELVWDEIADKVSSFAFKVNKNLKQLGLDINGDSYEFNNNGVATQTTPIVTRLDNLELGSTGPGIQNLGLDQSSESIVKLVASDGTDLSGSNAGSAVFQKRGSAGDLEKISLTSNISVTLTGAHWGKGGGGDLTDEILWVYLIRDSSSTLKLGVSMTGGLETIASASSFTVATSVTARTHMLVDTALASDSVCMPIARLTVNFDDTGNAGGEDYWTQQTDDGDTYVGKFETYFEGTLGLITAKEDMTLNKSLTVADMATIDTINTPSAGFVSNLGLDAAQTSAADDSILITGAAATLSDTNRIAVTLPSTSTPGQLVTLTATADVKLDLTLCHWGQGGGGNMTDYPLHVYAINDSGTLRWGVAALPGMTKWTTTEDETTQSNCTTVDKVFVDGALSGDSPCVEVGWFRADFNDTGDVWTVQTGSDDDINIGAAPPIWKEYQATGSWNTDVTFTGHWRRAGDSIEYYTKLVCGASPGPNNACTFIMMSGLSTNTTKLNGGTADQAPIGRVLVYNASVPAVYQGDVDASGDSALPQYCQAGGDQINFAVTTFPGGAATSSDSVAAWWTVPIQEFDR